MSRIQYEYPFDSKHIVKRFKDGIRGLQYDVPRDQIVLAVSTGTVVAAQKSSQHGFTIVVLNDDGFYVAYSGLKAAPKSFVGQLVLKHSKIGVVASKFTLRITNRRLGFLSGVAYDPHLFIRERLQPSSRSYGHGFSVYPVPEKLIQPILSNLKQRGLLAHYVHSLDLDAWKAIQTLISGYSQPINIDGVPGRFTAQGIQSWYARKGGTAAETPGFLTESDWHVFASMLIKRWD